MERDTIVFSSNILLIDDDEKVRTFLKIILRTLGFINVDTCNGGLDVERRMSVKPYALIFLDINMPGVDGMSLLKLILQKHPKTRVVMCSADSTAQNVKKAMTAGAAGFLAKPVLAKNIIPLFDKMGVEYDDLVSEQRSH
ncbi:response regulator [Planctobacterium marinum]|uniref:Response regulatory domain-containing protein n=1 Tax=Planctobacterium marinum TaxID=1631968 RepID=A0AA48HW47_9ALTE|nr:hypothetical protein MACH26_24640 [Planctobacterium marinum]